MVEAKQKILIVEDDLDVASLLRTFFSSQGYEVLAVYRGEDGVQECQNSRPDVVILDIKLPDFDGFEVARRLRSNHRTANIPIIFLTEKRARSERLHGLALGAEDYIPKPFDVKELELRLRNALRRADQDSLTNTVTGLADGKLVDEHLSGYLNNIGWSMLIVSLENLDAFRESYGFVASDDVMRAVSLMIHHTIKDLGNQDDFLGHISLTDFVLITDKERAGILQVRIRDRLEQSLDYFYPIKDREGRIERSKRLFIRVGILNAGDGKFTSVDDLKIALLWKKN